MNGMTHWNRKGVTKRIHRKSGPQFAAQSVERVDIGDWSLGQDEDGSLFVHNVSTGNRVYLAQPTAPEEGGA